MNTVNLPASEIDVLETVQNPQRVLAGQGGEIVSRARGHA